MKRIDFIKRITAIMAIGIPLLSVSNGCSSEEVTPNTNPNDPKDCLANGTSASIGSNHGHSITVSKTDIENSVAKTYGIQGGADHNHDVSITAANFTSLKNNNSIQVSSTSGGGHTHSVSVSCA